MYSVVGYLGMVANSPHLGERFAHFPNSINSKMHAAFWHYRPMRQTPAAMDLIVDIGFLGEGMKHSHLLNNTS
jgi:hypothetical protein